MSKIEEAARAIYEEQFDVELRLFGAISEWADTDADDREMWVDMARAALLAIREPDAGMRRAFYENEDATDGGFARGWQAAIDHALTQDTTLPKPKYPTFEDWYSEMEGHSLRSERFDGDVEWLRAAWQAALTQENGE